MLEINVTLFYMGAESCEESEICCTSSHVYALYGSRSCEKVCKLLFLTTIARSGAKVW